MKFALLLLLTVVCFQVSYSECTFQCNARYFRQGNPIVGQTQGAGEYGGFNIMVPGSSEWSPWYRVNVTFCSGFEYNRAAGGVFYNDNRILAVIAWGTGGHSTVVLNNWVTTLQYLTQDELLYNNETGERIRSMSGTDNEGRSWQFSI